MTARSAWTPSSPYAMARLLALKDKYRLAFAQRSRRGPARHRHALGGADEPQPLPGRCDPTICSTHRPRWPVNAAVGKTLVSSSMIDRVVTNLGRSLHEVPVGFKWFVAGPVRWLLLLRRRGKRRCKLPPPGRHRVDDRQGWPDHGPAGGRNYRPHRQGSGSALSRADVEVRSTPLYAHRRAGDAGAEGSTWQVIARRREGVRPLPASRSRTG